MVANGEFTYPLVFEHSYRKSPFLIGKPSINGPFSIAMLVYQRVYDTMGDIRGILGDPATKNYQTMGHGID